MERIFAFFDQGGELLWAILFVSVLMSTLILERYWFYYDGLPRLSAEWLAAWRGRAGSSGFHQLRLRETLIARHEARTTHGLRIIEVLTQVLPLLGLLGTVSGMIQVFEVINLFGAGNARGMAAGISQALVTTMAGLITALSGLFFSANLTSRARNLIDRFSARLIEE